MENEKLDLQVGDRVTYKFIDDNFSRIVTDIVSNNNPNNYSGIRWFKEQLEDKCIEILKIERPKYEVVEEKKELLTDEEREFLKDICKYYRNAKKIEFYDTYLSISDNRNYVLLNPDYPNNMKFENIEKQREYTLEELGLEQQ